MKQGKVDGTPSKRMPPPGQCEISQPKTLSKENVKASSNESFWGGKKRKLFPYTSRFEPATLVSRCDNANHCTIKDCTKTN